MLFYGEKNVYEAGKDRIRNIFDKHEGSPIVVCFSGGKDSTVILNLTKEVMDERGIKKIPVFWCDQEIEAPMVVEHCRKVMNLSWVDPYWVQSEYPKYNSHKGAWEKAWSKDVPNIRSKEPDNPLTDFDLSDYDKYSSEYDFFLHKIFGDGYVGLGGLHIDESPTRRISLLRDFEFCPKVVGTGGSRTYYPLFDWQVKDIWYYIFSNRVPYCKLYDYMFSKIPLQQCRVGSFWHEQSHKSIQLMREIDIDFYNRVQKRLSGVNATINSYDMLMRFAKTLPPYFATWREYAEHLIGNIVSVQNRKEMRTKMRQWYDKFMPLCSEDENKRSRVDELIGRSVVACAIKEDHTLRVLDNKRLELIKTVRK